MARRGHGRPQGRRERRGVTPHNRDRATVISLYSGAGGLDYGLEAARFDTVAAVEIDRDCAETLRKNRRWPVIQRSIFSVTTEEMLETAGVSRGEVDLVMGGPPCQPFSKSGFWVRGDSGRLGDPRSDTLGAFMRVVEEALPRAVLIENVEGLAYSSKDEGLKLLQRRLALINRRTGSKYQPVSGVLNAADFGVPQVRRRFIMVAARNGRPFIFPQPTHCARDDAPQLLDPGLPFYRSAWDALADVTPEPGEDLGVRGKWGDLLRSIPEGQNYLYHTHRGDGLSLFGWRRRYWSFLLKLAKNRPSWTIQAQPGPAIGPFHWENRRLSMRELCRLQTIPDDVFIAGERTAVQRQIGNAVPSLLGEVLGREIWTQLLDRSRFATPLSLLPKDRSPAPPPEPPEPVPAQYRGLAGRHAPHPGTGRGNSARRRQQALSQ
jgi:DNA (cytosine-5)-methyltransferase 1